MGGFNFPDMSGGNTIQKAFKFGGTPETYNFGGSNQHGAFPTMTPPGGAPTASPQPAFPWSTPTAAQPSQPSQAPFGSPPYSGYPFASYPNNINATPGAVGAADKLPGGAGTVPTTDPLFTQGFDSWLRTQMGSGISPFNLSSYLPSSGGQSGAGQVAAPLNPQLQQLQQFLMSGTGGGAGMQNLLQLAQTGGLGNTGLGQLSQTGGQQGALGQIGQTGGIEGLMKQLFQSGGLNMGNLGQLAQTGGLTGSLGQMAQNGSPISALPEWQAMVQAQQTGIQQNQANLKEQFAHMGNLSSSPSANAMALYNAQTTADQNSLLGQLQTGALENAQGRSLQAGEFGIGTQSQLGQFGASMQNQIGQQGIQNQLSSLLPSLQTQLSADISALGAQGSASSQLTGLGGQMGQFTQGLDQQSIQNLMQEYFMTQPQNNPLLNMEFGLATTFPPSYTKQGGVGAGIIGALPGLGSILSGIGGLI